MPRAPTHPYIPLPASEALSGITSKAVSTFPSSSPTKMLYFMLPASTGFGLASWGAGSIRASCGQLRARLFELEAISHPVELHVATHGRREM